MGTAITEQPVNEVYGKNHDKIDVEKAVELRLKGLSYADIAKHFNCHKSAVHQRIADIVGPVERVDVFKRHRAELLAGVQARILKTLDEDSIKSAPLAARATTFGILFDKERLERGESTSNIAYADMSGTLSELRAERQRLAEELGVDVPQEAEWEEVDG